MSYSNPMAGYTKLFSRILDSTIWQEDSETRVLWITMLAMANRDGVVESTIPGLAVRARISLSECESALEKFQQPDKYSWSQEEGGRRIKVVNGGWFLVNHAKYRELMSSEVQREKTRLRVHKLRERRKNVTPVTSNALYDIPSPTPEAEAVSQKQVRAHFQIPSIGEIKAYCQQRKNSVDWQQFFNHYTANGWKVGRNGMKNWRAAVQTWERNGFNSNQKDRELLRIDLRDHANPECSACCGSGYRQSYSRPDREEPCECAAPDAAWRTA